MNQLKHNIQQCLQQFAGGTLRENALALFDALGYRSEIRMQLAPNTAEHFLELYDAHGIFDQKRRTRALCAEWKAVDLLFQLTEAEITEQHTFFQVNAFDPNEYQSYLFFAIELQGDAYPRGALAAITREINRLFLMPALILFKHGATLTFAIINRRLHKLDSSKDVLEKVTLIKDIRISAPHRAHIEILHDLSCAELLRKHKFTNFSELHRAWQATLDITELNKRFFRELADWYFWAKDYVQFPEDVEPDQEIRNAKNLIRLLTRIMFIWFIKEKSLVPETLFDRGALPGILKKFQCDEQSSTYYQAILQNLFFATLNQQMDKRAFAREGAFEAHKKEYGVKTLLRYADQFAIAKEDALALFAGIPFLNGGLFDCLDKEDERGRVVYVDGFSRNPRKWAQVPDILFFMPQEREVDLTAAYDPSSKKPLLRKVRGLFDILNSYKFTVAENTPVEEEIALDPELLGKAFENLLASYNPETQTTARKQTGSFYTPREIVNYMVDESLIAYLMNIGAQASLSDRPQRPASQSDRHNGHNGRDGRDGRGGWEDTLRRLLSYSEEPHGLSEEEVRQLIQAVNRCKILDPACGSGAFPLGVLHKLVHVLHKLDPDNQLWKQEQKERIIGEKIAELTRDQALAEHFSDEKVREQAIQAIQDRLQEIEEIFDREYQFDDYARKLYLIENCIYGVDIQPIAVQIAKLRCFISLIIDQKPRPTAENLGLRALPNLETKFVAANTLLGLDKPKGQQMALKNLKIEQLENDLKTSRHQYFTAKTRHEKLAAQQQDNTLRRQIAKLLVNDVWDTSSAQQVVAFDPYDQNASAPFFEPEWMFGMTDGFDIVIGNPPYVDIKQLPNKTVKTLFQLFSTTHNRINLYSIFIEKSCKLLNKTGILVFINPNSILLNSSYLKIRKFIMKDFAKIIKLPDNIFENAIVETIILILIKSSYRPNIVLGAYYKKDQNIDFHNLLFRRFKKEVWQENKDCKFNIFVSPEINPLLEKIDAQSSQLLKFVDFSLGITPYDKYKGHSQDLIKGRRFHSPVKLDNSYVPLIAGKNILRYCVMETVDEFLKYGEWLGAPRQKRFFTEPRIIIRQIVSGNPPRIYAGYTEKELYHTQIGFAILKKKESQLALKYLLALLNSTLLNFYHTYRYLDVEKDTFQKVLIENCKLFPIKVATQETQRSFILSVDRILAAKQQNPAADTHALEAEIDRLVYALYGLTEEEIAIVEGKV